MDFSRLRHKAWTNWHTWITRQNTFVNVGRYLVFAVPTPRGRNNRWGTITMFSVNDQYEVQQLTWSYKSTMERKGFNMEHITDGNKLLTYFKPRLKRLIAKRKKRADMFMQKSIDEMIVGSQLEAMATRLAA